MVQFVGGNIKNYAFNIMSRNPEVVGSAKIGTLISSWDYQNDMLITALMEEPYRYVNTRSGELKFGMSNTNDIKLININLDLLQQIVSFVKVRIK